VHGASQFQRLIPADGSGEAKEIAQVLLLGLWNWFDDGSH